jgi:hypothetical protein
LRLRAICVCVQPDAGSDAIADAGSDARADAGSDACADAEVRGSIRGDASSWHKAHWRVRGLVFAFSPTPAPTPSPTPAPTPAPTASLTVITDANLGEAVTAWLTNPSTAETTFGPIADWNTAAVTSMAALLYPTVAPATTGTARPTFNGDISKWNTASVSNMAQACAHL